MAGRRALLQSRAAAGLRRRRHRRRGAATPMAKRKNPTSPTRATTRRASSCARRSGWAASARRSRASTASSSGEKDVSRVTLQVGKYSIKDLFDGNDYAEDPRIDFLNWSIWASGAFDYPADRLGLTWGFTAELNQAALGGACGIFPGRRPAQLQHFRHEPCSRAAAMSANWRCVSSPMTVRTYCGWGPGSPAPLPAPTTKRLRSRHSTRAGPHRQRHHRPDPPGPHQVRLLSQPPAGAQRRYRPVRPLQLE